LAPATLSCSASMVERPHLSPQPQPRRRALSFFHIPRAGVTRHRRCRDQISVSGQRAALGSSFLIPSCPAQVIS
jgi:hypothetical protein